MARTPPVEGRDDPNQIPGAGDGEHLEPDWYGWQARRKRKNDGDEDAGRVGLARLRAVASALSALAVIVIGIAIIMSIVTQPLATVRLVTVTPGAEAGGGHPTETPTAYPVVTLPPRMASPAPASTQPPPIAPQVVEMAGDGQAFRVVQKLNISGVAPGAVLRGLAIGPDRTLYVAQTVNAGVEAIRCDAAEAVLTFDRATSRTEKLALLHVAAPRALAFDSTGDLLVLAHYTEDCVSFTQALLLYEGAARRLAGIFRFESLSADALLVAPGDRIFVTLSGFAGGVSQKHLVELRWDAAARQLRQVQDYADDAYDARYVALALNGSTLLMVRVHSGEPCALRTLDLTEPRLIVDPSRGTPLPLTPTLSSAPPEVQTGPSMIAQACPIALGRGPNVPDGQLVGLSVAGNVAALISVQTGTAERYVTLPVTRPTSLIIDPTDGHWFIAGAGSP